MDGFKIQGAAVLEASSGRRPGLQREVGPTNWKFIPRKLLTRGAYLPIPTLANSIKLAENLNDRDLHR